MRTSSFAALRASIFAAAGLGLGACGSQVSIETAAQGGVGGAGAGTSGSLSSNVVGVGGAGGFGTVGIAVAVSVTSSTGSGVECAGAAPMPASDGSFSGFSRCPDGTIHRTTAAHCSPIVAAPTCKGTEAVLTCKSNADCTAGPNGQCFSTMISGFGAPMTGCACTYPCETDAQCGAGQVCVCPGIVKSDQPASFCAPASCTDGSSCASGECAITSHFDGCYNDVELACRSSSDVCRTDADCQKIKAGTQCALMNEQWVCTGTTCAIGRPLLVEGRARTAPAARRNDWAARSETPSVAGLDARTRAALTEHWTHVAALEHASVASFAGFTLDLLALGAPAALVAEAQRAGLDEIEHARIGYGLASAYAGRDVGPGALELAGMRFGRSLEDVLRGLIEEGCVGETLGAAEALALASRAEDPAIRRAHERIAADEQRHAELAWRALGWLLGRAGAEAIELAARCFADAAARYSADPPATSIVAPAHGLLGSAAIGEIRRRALAEIVGPCAARWTRELHS